MTTDAEAIIGGLASGLLFQTCRVIYLDYRRREKVRTIMSDMDNNQPAKPRSLWARLWNGSDFMLKRHHNDWLKQQGLAQSTPSLDNPPSGGSSVIPPASNSSAPYQATGSFNCPGPGEPNGFESGTAPTSQEEVDSLMSRRAARRKEVVLNFVKWVGVEIPKMDDWELRALSATLAHLAKDVKGSAQQRADRKLWDPGPAIPTAPASLSTHPPSVDL